jgi:hypothetical protein
MRRMIDVFGSRVELMPNVPENVPNLYLAIQRILLYPSYMIDVVGEARYFFGAVSWECNLMLVVRRLDSYFVVEEVKENPPSSEVQELLEKGSLTSFL